jgi:hypothetical protein
MPKAPENDEERSRTSTIYGNDVIQEIRTKKTGYTICMDTLFFV